MFTHDMILLKNQCIIEAVFSPQIQNRRARKSPAAPRHYLVSPPASGPVADLRRPRSPEKGREMARSKLVKRVTYLSPRSDTGTFTFFRAEILSTCEGDSPVTVGSLCRPRGACCDCRSAINADAGRRVSSKPYHGVINRSRARPGCIRAHALPARCWRRSPAGRPEPDRRPGRTRRAHRPRRPVGCPPCVAMAIKLGELSGSPRMAIGLWITAY